MGLKFRVGIPKSVRVFLLASGELMCQLKMWPSADLA